MPKQKLQLTEEEKRERAYSNIADGLPFLSQIMRNHHNVVRKMKGIITEKDMDELLEKLVESINHALEGVTKKRLNITVEE